MQNRYAGDIGDFGKFVLLKKIFPLSSNSIGVIWYLFPDETHNGDGRHIQYMNNPDYSRCDPLLINGLSNVVKSNRAVSSLEAENLLGKNTIYYSKPLDFHLTYNNQTKAHKEKRILLRLQWLEKAIDSVKNCNVVFLDPDNGLEINSVSKLSQIKAGKFAYYLEVVQFFNTQRTCVIYHHLNRTNTHDAQMQHRANEIKNTINNNSVVFGLRFYPYSPRAYFILTTRNEASKIRQNIKEFLSSSCSIGWDSYIEV